MLPIILGAAELLKLAAESKLSHEMVQKILAMAKNSSVVKSFVNEFDTLTGEVAKNSEVQKTLESGVESGVKSAVKQEMNQSNQQNQNTPQQQNTNKIMQHALLYTFAQVYLQHVQQEMENNKENYPQQEKPTAEQLADGLEQWLKTPAAKTSPEGQAFNHIFTDMTDELSQKHPPTENEVGSLFQRVEKMAVKAASDVVENKLGIGATSPTNKAAGGSKLAQQLLGKITHPKNVPDGSDGV